MIKGVVVRQPSVRRLRLLAQLVRVSSSPSAIYISLAKRPIYRLILISSSSYFLRAIRYVSRSTLLLNYQADLPKNISSIFYSSSFLGLLGRAQNYLSIVSRLFVSSQRNYTNGLPTKVGQSYISYYRLDIKQKRLLVLLSLGQYGLQGSPSTYFGGGLKRSIQYSYIIEANGIPDSPRYIKGDSNITSRLAIIIELVILILLTIIIAILTRFIRGRV